MSYSSSSKNKSITSIDTKTLNFLPTVKVLNIPLESPGTSYEIITSASPNDFMHTDHKNPSRDIGELSCSYTLPNLPDVVQPKGIMKSIRKVDKNVNKISKRQQPVEDTPQTQDNMTVVTIEDTSTDDSPGQPAMKIEIINLKSTDEQTKLENDPRNEQTENPENASTLANAHTEHTEKEHDPATTSSAKSSISDLHASDFFNPSEF